MYYRVEYTKRAMVGVAGSYTLGAMERSVYLEVIKH